MKQRNDVCLYSQARFFLRGESYTKHTTIMKNKIAPHDWNYLSLPEKQIAQYTDGKRSYRIRHLMKLSPFPLDMQQTDQEAKIPQRFLRNVCQFQNELCIVLLLIRSFNILPLERSSLRIQSWFTYSSQAPSSCCTSHSCAASGFRTGVMRYACL